MATISLDLVKTSVHFVGFDASGRVLTRRRYLKGQLAEITAKYLRVEFGLDTLPEHALVEADEDA